MCATICVCHCGFYFIVCVLIVALTHSISRKRWLVPFVAKLESCCVRAASFGGRLGTLKQAQKDNFPSRGGLPPLRPLPAKGCKQDYTMKCKRARGGRRPHRRSLWGDHCWLFCSTLWRHWLTNYRSNRTHQIRRNWSSGRGWTSIYRSNRSSWYRWY